MFAQTISRRMLWSLIVTLLLFVINEALTL